MLSVLLCAVMCLCTDQTVDDDAVAAGEPHLMSSQPLVQMDNIVDSDLSNSLPATQVISLY